MDSRDFALPTPTSPHPEAVEFVRFCRSRRRVAWPELYDEMWAVAARGLFRGFGFEDLSERGIEFGLMDMPALAALAQAVISGEATGPARRSVPAARRGLAVVGGAG